MNRGYIKLWRKIQDNEIWCEPRVFSKAEAWLDILMEARHQDEPGAFVIGLQRLTVNKGEVLYSLKTWANRWRWSVSRVKRVLGLFADCNMIELANETVTTRLRVLNYSKYTESRNANETDLKRTRNASETQAVTTKECKECKEEKNKTFSASDDAESADFWISRKKRKLAGKRLETFKQFWEAFNYRKDRASAIDAWLDIPQLTNGTVQSIVDAAKKEAENRPALIASGRTPIFAQGWITARRWEDEVFEVPRKKTASEELDDWAKEEDEKNEQARVQQVH